MLCLSCGTHTVKQKRRIIEKGHRIVALLTSFLISSSDIAEEKVHKSCQTYKFMCKSCFDAYKKHLSSYDKLKSSAIQKANFLKLLPGSGSHSPNEATDNSRKRDRDVCNGLSSAAKRINTSICSLYN
jgi:hypothetical protein